MGGSPADDDGAAQAPGSPDEPADDVMGLLADGVPMALVADLTDPAGPPSPVILEEEGLPEERWWVPGFQPGETGADDGVPGPAERDGAASSSGAADMPEGGGGDDGERDG